MTKKHSFRADVAKSLGVDQAIILGNLAFWIIKNKANERHFYEGYFWTYNSARAFAELFPYWSPSKISRILRDLEKKSVIKSGSFNKHSYDRTKWYTICDETILQKYTIDDAESKDGTLDSDEPIPDLKHSSQQHIVKSIEEGEDVNSKNASISKTETKEAILEFQNGFAEYHAERIYKEFPDAKKPHDSKNIFKDILKELNHLTDELNNNPKLAFEYLLETTRDIAEIFPRMNKYDKKYFPFAKKWFTNRHYKDIQKFEAKAQLSSKDRCWVPPSIRRERKNQGVTDW